MEPFFRDDLATIYHGDCREVMKTFPENSIDTILTDPPYGLKFMGKDWDHGVPGVHYWAEAFRVAKPGAFLLAFGGTRTFHRLTCAIEDAGWEIRDDIAFLSSLDEKERNFFCNLDPEQQAAFLDLFASQRLLLWVYGSGFPKSHDISKAIDKAAGAEREVVAIDEKQKRPNLVNMKSMGGGWDKTINGAIITAPATPEAQTWHGWGTALKPAWEPIVVAMKPLDKTFANNALTWGVAGLNIDGCRVGTEDMSPEWDREWNNNTGEMGQRYKQESRIKGKQVPPGRWPANVIHDGSEEVVGLFPANLESGYRENRHNHNHGRGPYGGNALLKSSTEYTKNQCAYDDGGGSASRFFYTAKAAPSERGENNNHPTVKPLDLMKYLCKLTATPSGGVILDPFMGSGTTLLAAREMGRKSIGIEIDPKSCKIAKNRMKQGMLNFAG